MAEDEDSLEDLRAELDQTRMRLQLVTAIVKLLARESTDPGVIVALETLKQLDIIGGLEPPAT
jgi:hypothetical protein